MTDDILIRENKGAVAVLTMNDPKTLNSLSETMLAALQTQFDALKDDTSIRAVIIKGTGKAFCAGHNLKEMTARRADADRGRGYFLELFQTCTRMMLTIRDLPQPVIAQTHGIATAAGCQLVATCDLAVAEQGTKFGVNGVNIGLFCSTPMVALSRNIPRKRAFEMLTTGEFMLPDEAQAVGLINRIAAPGQLDAVTMDLAETIAGKLGSAVKIGKQAYYNQMELPVDQAYGYTGEVMVENMLHNDTKEGIDAFLEKRAPNWQQD